jgi:hypothetical protein
MQLLRKVPHSAQELCHIRFFQGSSSLQTALVPPRESFAFANKALAMC